MIKNHHGLQQFILLQSISTWIS